MQTTLKTVSAERQGAKRVLSEGQFLRVIREDHWEYVERINASGAVMIIAVTPEHQIILIEEYRYPLHARTLGLPAGISGDEGAESPLESAKRELLEETGYFADEWSFLCEGPSSPGLTSEMVSFFLARQLKRLSDGGGTEGENIRVHLVPLDNAEQWLQQQIQAGKIIDPRIYMALYFLTKSMKDGKKSLNQVK